MRASSPRVWLLTAALAVACDRKPPPPAPVAPASAQPPQGTITGPTPLVSEVISGDPKEAARRLFGTPPKPGRVIGTVEATTNGDPQTNAAGVLALTGANGRIFTVYAASDGLKIGGPIDLGSVRMLATDGPRICASDRRTMRCANIDGSGVAQRSTGVAETAGMWGGPGVLLRATQSGSEYGFEASEDGFLTARRIGIPKRRSVVAAVVESRTRWTTVVLPTEGTIKPRYALTLDGGATPISDFGALDRTGWSTGDRLWPDQLVTGAFATETVVAERGEKQTTVTLPWSAAGGFAFAKHALLLFGRGASSNGGFLLVEFPSRHVSTFAPPGSHPFIAAGLVGGAIVAVTNEGQVLAWD
jgi:hypothetical protein